MSNGIGDIIYRTYKSITGRSTGKSEIDSWTNSLQYMERVINDSEIPGTLMWQLNIIFRSRLSA